jgi:hypothetical protein
VRELAADGWGRNRIAREVGLSGSTVSGIIRDAPDVSFDRTATAEATEAARVDAAERRAELSLALLEDAHRLRAQLWQPCTVGAFGGRDNVWTETRLAEPTFADKRAILTAVGNAVRDHVRLEQVDSDGGAAEAGSMLADLMTGIQAAHAAQLAAGAAEPADADGDGDQGDAEAP